MHRRRVRRRVRWRVVSARRLLVVLLAVAVGWELALDDRGVVVREVRDETLMAVHADGKRETVEILREDTTENAQEFDGSTYEVEVEEEVDEERARAAPVPVVTPRRPGAAASSRESCGCCGSLRPGRVA